MYFIKKQGKFSLTIEGRGALAGYLFILPFLIGFLAFMLTPIVESLIMVFSKVDIVAGHGLSMTFTGFTNLINAYNDYWFRRLLVEELGRMFIVVPGIIFFSLFIALLLNQEFRARGLVRSIFFLPVIISSGIIIGLDRYNLLLSTMVETIRDSSQIKTSITRVLEDILAAEGAASNFMAYIFRIINQIYTIAMSSGVQIVIFLSAFQTIPQSVYESARIEGATDWECFWKITFPMVSSMILVNVVYSVIEYFLRTDNNLMRRITLEYLLQNLDYSVSTTVAWVYTLVVIAIVGILVGLISRKVYYYE